MVVVVFTWQHSRHHCQHLSPIRTQQYTTRLFSIHAIKTCKTSLTESCSSALLCSSDEVRIMSLTVTNRTHWLPQFHTHSRADHWTSPESWEVDISCPTNAQWRAGGQTTTSSTLTVLLDWLSYSSDRAQPGSTCLPDTSSSSSLRPQTSPLLSSGHGDWDVKTCHLEPGKTQKHDWGEGSVSTRTDLTWQGSAAQQHKIFIIFKPRFACPVVSGENNAFSNYFEPYFDNNRHIKAHRTEWPPSSTLQTWYL